jgi:orotidine-5'-phosphate decarboxylase
MEAIDLRNELGDEFLLVTPGIRPANVDLNDQTRVVTPALALSFGASYLVIGRPISQAVSPLQALQIINDEIAA